MPPSFRPPAPARGNSAEHLFHAIAEEVLHGHRDLFDTLSPHEQEIVLQWLAEAIVDGEAENAIHDLLWELDFHTKPVDIKTFITDPHYMGRVAAGLGEEESDRGEAQGLHGKWVEDLCEVFRFGSPYAEWILTGGIGVGKGQPVDGRVATPAGWRRVGDLRVGDAVVGSNGLPTRVVGVYPRGRLPIYTVSFTDGALLQVDGDHLWAVRSPGDLYCDRAWRVVTTRDLRAEGVKHGAQRKWHIPLVAPVTFAPVTLPLPPYALGALLGDGGLTNGDSIRFSTADAEILEEVCCETGLTPRFSGQYDYRLVSEGTRDNPALDALRELEVCVPSYDKRIPPLYLRGAIPDRKRLLRGLMDTDGWVQNAGKASLFSSSSEQLARDVVELVQSLGGVATLHRKSTTHRDAFVVNVNTPFNPFFLRRKADEWQPRAKYPPRRMIDAITPAGEAEVVCIQVEADDNLYVADAYVVTHNTTVAMLALAYKLYFISCLRNPAGYYGLLPDSLMVFGIYSITKRQVADTGYYKLRGWLDSSPYFRFKFPRSRKIDSKIVFLQQNLQVIPGCVAEGTLVATPQGAVPIECLPREGGQVLSAVDTVSAVRYSRVVEAGWKKCVDLEREDGTIVTVSESHRIEVIRHGARTFIEAQDIQPGEVVLGVRHVEADPRVLSATGQTTTAVQGLHEAAVQRALPRHQDLCRQDGPTARPAEAMPEVPEDQATGSVSSEDGPDSWRDEDVLAFLVQGLRVDGYQALVPGEHGGAEGVRPETPFHVGAQATREEALEAVLQGESRFDLGSYVVACRPFQAERAVAEVAQGEPRQSAGVPHRVAQAVPGEGPCQVAEVGEVGTGTACASCGGTEARSAEEVVTGYAYAVGCRTGAGILWRKVLLLWSRPLPANLDVGPRGAVEPGRWYDAGEYRARVLDVQQPQAHVDGGRVLPDTTARASVAPAGNGRTASYPPLSSVRIVAVRPAGLRRCYDIVEAGPSRSFFAGGLSVKNSQELHALGLDLYAFGMDELNFMRARADKERGQMVGQAYDLYNATHSRITSRYLRPGGTIPGIMLLMSSKNAQTSFLEDLLKKRREEGMANTYVSDYALWEVKPTHKFILPSFRVEVGDRVAPSRVLRDGNLDLLEAYYDKQITDAQARKRSTRVDPEAGEAPRKNAHIVTVPGEFLRVFKQDVDQALREVAGVATFNVSPLIRDRSSIFDSIRDDLPNPFTRTEVVLSIEDETLLEDFFVTDRICRTVESKWIPRINPQAPRFAHVDLGLTGDCAGLAMGHVSGILRHERTNPDGTLSAVENPFIIIDLMLRIRPPSGSEIDFSKIRSFLRYLKRLFPLRKVTLDGFQSSDFMQIIRKPPFRLEADLLSVDRTEDPYLSLRSAHFDRRIAHYRYAPYEDEVLDLQRVRRANTQGGLIKWRIDHPAKATKGGKGSKDVADAAAGVVWLLMTDPRSLVGVPILASEDLSGERSLRVVDPKRPARPRKKRTRTIAGTPVDMHHLRDNLR